jgi:hypothetical protein
MKNPDAPTANDQIEPQAEDAENFALQDWDAIVTGTLVPGSLPLDELGGEDQPEPGELPEEDDDNPYQNSDEALPEDPEEAALRRNPSKEGGLFDEV